MSDILLYILLLLLLIIVLVIFVVSIVAIYFFISSCFMRYPPPIPSSGRLKDKVLEDICAYLQDKEGLTFMDLGSGWGTLLLPLAKRFPQHRFIGVERAFTPYAASVLRAHNLPNLHFEHGDIFKTDIKRCDVIFCFLMQKLMDGLTPRLKENLRSGAYVYSCRFTCPNWPPERTVSLGTPYETFYVYRQE
jgi:hypothetical protein